MIELDAKAVLSIPRKLKSQEVVRHGFMSNFAYFEEVLLQENYDAAYLEAITKKIDEYALQYRELYTTAFTKIEGYTRSSLQAKGLGGLSAVTKAAGEAIAKIPSSARSMGFWTVVAGGIIFVM